MDSLLNYTPLNTDKVSRKKSRRKMLMVLIIGFLLVGLIGVLFFTHSLQIHELSSNPNIQKLVKALTGLLLGILIITISGSLALWFVGRFSSDPPYFYQCLIASVITNIVSIVFSLMGLPNFLSLVILIFVLVKYIHLDGPRAFVGTALYAVLMSLIAAVPLLLLKI